MTGGSVFSSFKGKRDFEYPFRKTWVYAGAVMAGFSIVFAIVFLIGEEPEKFSFYTFTFMIHPVVLYFLFTSFLTVVILSLKFYLYSAKDESSESHLFMGEQKTQGFLRRWSLIIVLFLTVAVLSVPVVLSVFLAPLWWFIGVSGFVPAVTIPEIILYMYSRRSRNEK